MEISVASAIKEDLLNDALVIGGHIDELRADALAFVEGVSYLFIFQFFHQFITDVIA